MTVATLPRVHYGLPFAEYLAIPAVHASSLKMMGVSPRAYRHAVTTDRTETTALRVGSATHAMALMGYPPPDVAVFPGATRRGKEWEEFHDANADKLILKADEMETATHIAKAIHADPTARLLLTCGAPEVTLLWDHEGTACKCRADYLSDGGAALVELKTTRTIEPWAFAREVAQRGYHIQMGMYAKAVERACGKRPEVFLIAAENVAPFDVVVYRVSDADLMGAWATAKRWIERVAECERSGVWPGVSGGETRELILPEWAQDTAVLTFNGEAI